MPKFLGFVLFVSGSLLFSATALAQFTLLYQKDGVASGDHLGIFIASAGDVNGDGRAVFIVGAVYASPGGRTNAGSVYVYSGVDGFLIYQKDGSMAG